jgi:hypothetical protein
MVSGFTAEAAERAEKREQTNPPRTPQRTQRLQFVLFFSKNSFSELCALSVPVKKWYGRRSVEIQKSPLTPLFKEGN